MNSETYIDFCFIREAGRDTFADEVRTMLEAIFTNVRLKWYINEKQEENMDIIMAEIKGMSKWQTKEEAEEFIETQAEDAFWEYLQGYQIFIYPQTKGCGSCGCH